MDERFTELWQNLYATLRTSQIEKAIRDARLDWNDWRDFCEHMRQTLNKEARP